MIENLMALIKDNAQESVINNPAIPNEHNESTIALAGNAITNGLQNAISSGNISDLLGMFTKGNIANNKVTNSIQQQFSTDLASQTGIDAKAAGDVANSFIPDILKNLVSKTNDPNNSSFDLQGIINQFSGGKLAGFDISGIVQKMSGGLDKDADGDVDLTDLTNLLSSNGGSAGSLLDGLKGMFK